MACDARQHSDQMICTTCGLVWDTNDISPPACNPKRKKTTAEWVRELKEWLANSEVKEHEQHTAP